MACGPVARNFLLGILCLLLANVIWGSVLFYTMRVDYKRPFFSSYCYAASLSVFIVGFVFVDSWRSRCCCSGSDAESWKPVQEEDAPDSETEIEREERDFAVNSEGDMSSEDTEFKFMKGPPATHEMSQPKYEKVKRGSLSDSDRSSTESLSGSGSSPAIQARVRFSKVKEVRILPPEEADDALYARRSYESSKLVVQELLSSNTRMSLKEIASLSFLLSFLFLGFVYLGNLGSFHTSHWSGQLCLSSGALWVLLLSSLLPSHETDSFTMSKFLSVSLCLAGNVMVSASAVGSKSLRGKDSPLTSYVAVYGVAAFLLSIFIVVLKRRARNLTRINLFMFLGFLGFWIVLLYWPIIFILDILGVEQLSLPDTLEVWGWLAIRSVFSAILAWSFWLWGCFLLSPLIGVLSILILCPVDVGFAAIINEGSLMLELLIAGAVTIIAAYILALAFHWRYNSDPVGDFLGVCCGKCMSFCELLTDGLYVGVTPTGNSTAPVVGDSEEVAQLLN